MTGIYTHAHTLPLHALLILELQHFNDYCIQNFRGIIVIFFSVDLVAITPEPLNEIAIRAYVSDNTAGAISMFIGKRENKSHTYYLLCFLFSPIIGTTRNHFNGKPCLLQFTLHSFRCIPFIRIQSSQVGVRGLRRHGNQAAPRNMQGCTFQVVPV